MSPSFTLEVSINPEQAGTYFTVPFTMPGGMETMTLSYSYERHNQRSSTVGAGILTSDEEINIIDLGLIAPDGSQIGASGSDKREFTLSETFATPGYRAHALDAGEWKILVGAYKIAPAGMKVTYHISLTPKHLRLLRGDLHTHTLASDGVLSADELCHHAQRHGLDFLAITDHNQMISVDALPKLPGLTVIPGMEWTHYRGHANFLGVERPYEGSFAANTLEEVLERFNSAREHGAVITLNHPFDGSLGFQFDWQSLPYDCLEIWNGPMRESNLHTLAVWQKMLEAGKKVPICGGSDYHRDTPFQILGGPTLCVMAQSAGASDILYAVRHGHSFITFAPGGPALTLRAGDAMLGESVEWQQDSAIQLSVEGLIAGDVVRMITATETTNLAQTNANGQFSAEVPVNAPGFARIEVLRSFLPGVPMLPALISNPIYFD